jgi:copper chaperone NosL
MNKPDILFLAGVILLTGAFFFPLWNISLGVPQDPQEIFINIRISEIENGSKKALEIMNVLNHNIGMKKIDPDSIPELTYMPWVLGAFIITGLAAGFQGNAWLRVLYLVLALVLLALALYDLYLWQYDYGHNLAEDAPIKLEGGAFQPPLIGQKTVANFIVKSVPSVGAAFPVLSLIFMITGIIRQFKTT